MEYLKNGIRLPSGKPTYASLWYCVEDYGEVSESNDQGTWYNYKLDRITEITKDIESMMLEARNMYQSVRKGEVKMANKPCRRDGRQR